MSDKMVISHHEGGQGSVRSYSIGFGLSLVLTIAAYLLASRQLTTGWALIFALAALAVAQLTVQLVFFLHLGRESKPRWNLVVFAFALMVVIILVFGSLWIMHNLNYAHHNLPANATDQQIIKDEGYQSSN